MAKVPSLAPEVTLRQDALPGLNLNAPAGAFGGASAAALSGVGKELEQAGDRIFARAVALQQLDIEAEARDATTDYMLESGKIYEDYKSLQGGEAPKSYPKYQEDLRTSRENIRERLGSPAAQRQFDAQTQSTMARTVLYGASHAAQENKKHLVTSAEARIAASGDAAAQHPRDDRAFEIELRNTDREVMKLAGIKGWDGDVLTNEQFSARSKLWASRIAGLSRIDPFTAGQMLDANRDKLTAGDLFRVDGQVRTQSRAVGSATIAEEVYKAGQGGPDVAPKTLAELQDEAEKKAKAAFPDDPVMAKNARAAVTGIYNQDKYAKRQENIANLQTVDNAIVTGVRTEQELLASPRVAQAFNDLHPTQQLAVPGKINRYNAARDMVTNQDNFNRLYGLSNNNVIEFLNTDLTTQQLSQTDMQRLMKVQNMLKERAGGDPRVTQAMGWLKAARAEELKALGVYQRDNNNTTPYDQLTGAMQLALTSWLEGNKKPATERDVVEKIGPELIRQVSQPRAWYNPARWVAGNKDVPQFARDVPDDFVTGLQAEAKAQGLPEYTPAQIRRHYFGAVFNNLYGKKKPAQ